MSKPVIVQSNNTVLLEVDNPDFEIPQIVLTTVKEQMQRYGLLKLIKTNDDLILTSTDTILLNEIIKL